MEQERPDCACVNAIDGKEHGGTLEEHRGRQAKHRRNSIQAFTEERIMVRRVGQRIETSEIASSIWMAGASGEAHASMSTSPSASLSTCCTTSATCSMLDWFLGFRHL